MRDGGSGNRYFRVSRRQCECVFGVRPRAEADIELCSNRAYIDSAPDRKNKQDVHCVVHDLFVEFLRFRHDLPMGKEREDTRGIGFSLS